MQMQLMQGFSQLVGSATRGDWMFSSQIDLPFINCCNTIAGISEHEAIYVESSLALDQHQPFKHFFGIKQV